MSNKNVKKYIHIPRVTTFLINKIIKELNQKKTTVLYKIHSDCFLHELTLKIGFFSEPHNIEICLSLTPIPSFRSN